MIWILTCQLDTQIETAHGSIVKQVSVAEFKANFSEWLDAVQRGEPIAIQYGRRKKVVAILTPPTRLAAGAARRLGALKGKARFSVGPGFKMTEGELLQP